MCESASTASVRLIAESTVIAYGMMNMSRRQAGQRQRPEAEGSTEATGVNRLDHCRIVYRCASTMKAHCSTDT